MSTGGPDLFVICKSCGSEVSPYITECPYCGNRLRKRAPKLDRDGPRRRERRRRRPPTPSLPRLRRGEIPGIRAESRPYATIALVAARAVGTACCGGPRSVPEHLVIVGKPGSQWWRVLTAPFVYDNTGYAFVVLGAIALFGWLLERRHGPVAVLALFAIGGVGGTAATAAALPVPVVLGANGAALALLVAWAIPDLLELRAGAEVEGDLLGTAVIAVVVALMPLALRDAELDLRRRRGAGGLAVGLPLARAGSAPLSPPSPTRSSRPCPRAAAPITAPGSSSARSGATAASSPPEVIASHTSQRRAAGTPSAKRVKLSAWSRLRRVPPATARSSGSASSSQHALDRRDRGGVELGGQRRWPAPARAGGRAARTRSRR